MKSQIGGILIVLLGIITISIFIGWLSKSAGENIALDKANEISRNYYNFVKARDNYRFCLDRSKSPYFLSKLNKSGEECLMIIQTMKEENNGYNSHAFSSFENDIKKTISWLSM